MHNPRQPRDRGAFLANLQSFITAAVVVMMIVGTICVLGILTSAFGDPRVGDMLVFRPSATIAGNDVVSARLEAQTGGQGRSCDLNPAVMAQGGGSIVVERHVLPGKRYLVHWAGSHTANGSQDCGSAADVTLSALSLKSLINALGGRGIVGGGNVF